MDKNVREQLGELVSDIEGLHQLVTWQLALVREVRGKVNTMIIENTPAPRGGRRRRRK